ncbi:MAG: hypothetical protein JWP82_73, partial [Humibacillus sp.]|nr:hypothetical protein [Humibacillus sp.]
MHVWVSAPAAMVGWEQRLGDLDAVERARLAGI